MTTPKNRDELRELIARTVVLNVPTTTAALWTYEGVADAILAAMEDAGCAVVPVEATNEMVGAVEKMCRIGTGLSYPMWDTMLFASPYREGGE